MTTTPKPKQPSRVSHHLEALRLAAAAALAGTCIAGIIGGAVGVRGEDLEHWRIAVAAALAAPAWWYFAFHKRPGWKSEAPANGG